MALAKLRAASGAGHLTGGSRGPEMSVPENGMLPPRDTRRGFGLGRWGDHRQDRHDNQHGGYEGGRGLPRGVDSTVIAMPSGIPGHPFVIPAPAHPANLTIPPSMRPGAGFIGGRSIIDAPPDPDVMGIPLSALTPKLANQVPQLGVPTSNMKITPIMQRALEQIRRNIAPGA